MDEEKEKLAKKEKKEPIKPMLFVPEPDRDGYAVFRFLDKEDAELTASAVSTSKGLKIKTAKENTCPLEPDKPYDKSVCKKLNDLFNELFKKRKKKRKEKKECRICNEIE